ncbi:DNA repair photolyase [Brevibacterium iodinum ATCC 49514]|uniref:DNA repair photolyase n=1 Tax=Brevibacterium iodinum ATCC 49514 TaxID=1255616 RepID=A0A2H1IMG7_9MICO|nr:Rv2578c family radical SAM protein [Brevibacterium iodinum]SMX76363.1 DNA repair photolyase [Brevibacterium iodinum ATCC 49514]SUW11903.1 Radical SAM superfamily [Brevibacterium iodinum]
MRWNEASDSTDPSTPVLFGTKGLVRSVQTPEFSGITFHEVLAKSALNKVPQSSSMPFSWTVNPYRGCSHACVYCFARNTHRYLDLDSGTDFDRQVVVKINIADVLAAELARPSWARDHVALGTNTDPYQRAEGRYSLMPGIITALAEQSTPMSILTKGTLLRRDLPLLARVAEDAPVEISMSIAVHDDALQQSLEPGTPTTKARLATVRAAAELGFDVTVFMMPIMPKLTDSRDHLESALRAIKGAGAARVVYGALHLRPGAREWFFEWLERHRPELLPRYRRMYAGSSYASTEYRRWLSERINPLIDRYDLRGRSDDDYPATSRMRGRPGLSRTPQKAGEPAPTQQLAAPSQQALF